MPATTSGAAACRTICTTRRSGPSIRASPTRNGSRRWAARAAATRRCSHWSSGPTSSWRRRKRVGGVENDAELNRAISPLYHVDKIKAPLLIVAGQYDVRVTLKNIEGMVKALRDDNRDVVYVVYTDEGHGWGRPENVIDYYARVEQFLAKTLGGRAEGLGRSEEHAS